MSSELATNNPASSEKQQSAIGRFFASARNTDAVRQAILFAILAVGALAMIIPFEWMIATSLSRGANAAMPRIPRFWPEDFSIFNYQVAAANLPLIRFYFNSIVTTGITTVLYMFFSALTGYTFAKGSFVGKSVLFLILLMTLMIPFEIRMIPLYLLMRNLHLNDTYAALILPFITGGFGTFLMRQYIAGIPDDLVDAARVDGANEFTIFWRIILPLCGPALAAIAVLCALWRWNDVIWPLLVISDRNLYTVTLGLATTGRSSGIYTGVALATAAIAVLPLIILYLFLQRYIIKGIMLSGMKG
jgi:multiple sugar transport system permease protein